MDLAYIAGLFDGEGCVFISMPRASKNGVRYKRLTAKIAQKDPMILLWVQERFGIGTVLAGRGAHDYKVVAGKPKPS